jgi:NAD(P)-dependent dehydrogenase (short-subunit alcohol dehydrogenase family)
MSRIAIVTGAGSGIGRAVSLALVEAGFSVVLAGRRADALAETAASAADPDRVLAAPTDVTDEAEVARLFKQSVARFGRVDVLFNNAGAGAPPMPFEDISLAQWNAVAAVNLTGAFLCTRAAFKQMKMQTPQGGRIINNGSISAHTPRPLSAPYTATKHALTGLTKSLALDGRAHNIVCGQIDIGNAATAMAARMAQGALHADGRIAPEPSIDVGLVADAVVHMASLPLEANIPFMTIMAARMPYAGRG